MHRVLSLGAGVQSTTVALLALHGEIEPIDVAVFADTGCEPQGVYRHLEWLSGVLESGGVPVEVVRNTAGGSTGNLAADVLRRAESGAYPSGMPPLYARYRDRGNVAMTRRECTVDYKVRPLTRHIVERYGINTRAVREPVVERLFGISIDEVFRMRTSRNRWEVNSYPLVDLRMSRHDCLLWLERHRYPRPPRSSCVFCPYRSNAEWRELRDTDPEGWAAAVAFDDALRSGGIRFREGADLFVHRSCVPLREVDLLSLEDEGQLALWGEECQGMCGV